MVNLCRNSDEFGVKEVNYLVDFNKVVERKAQVVNQLRDGIAAMLAKAKVTVVGGMATFKTDTVVTVGEEEFTAPHIIIATGSSSKALPIPGADQPWCLDSTGVLNLDYVPASLVIVGGGVIGLEFASVFNAFGSEVTVIEFMKNIAPTFDSDISKRLKQSLSKRGVKIITGAAVKRMEQTEDYQILTTYELKGKEESVASTDLLMAVGRKPNVDGLNLEAAGVEYSPKGIVVDDNMRTNVPHIYAIGDVNALSLIHISEPTRP